MKVFTAHAKMIVLEAAGSETSDRQTRSLNRCVPALGTEDVASLPK